MCANIYTDRNSGYYRLVIFVRNWSNLDWHRYAQTEVVQVNPGLNFATGCSYYELLSQGSCDPVFMVSIAFRQEHGINEKTQVCFTERIYCNFVLKLFLF